MLTRFEFATAQRIVFGSGAAGQAAALAAGMGRRPMVVTGRDVARCRWLLDRLADEGLPATCHAFSGEPSVEEVREGARLAQAVQVDLVIAFGGGSALDGGKAIAALATNGGDPAPFLEGIGQGKALERRPLPCIAIPTTAGTGSEVTRNAVLLSREHGLKVSLRHPWLLPQVALVDPETTLSLPPEVTASTGLDALTQLIEPFVSIRANPLTDAICREGLGRAAPALHRAWADGRDRAAREAMALASLFGGLALANAGLGAVHGLAAPLGGPQARSARCRLRGPVAPCPGCQPRQAAGWRFLRPRCGTIQGTGQALDRGSRGGARGRRGLGPGAGQDAADAPSLGLWIVIG